MKHAGLDEAQAEIKIAGRNINNLRYADDSTLTAGSEELKSLLMKVKGWRVQDGERGYTCGGFISIFGKTNTIL